MLITHFLRNHLLNVHFCLKNETKVYFLPKKYPKIIFSNLKFRIKNPRVKLHLKTCKLTFPIPPKQTKILLYENLTRMLCIVNRITSINVSKALNENLNPHAIHEI
jgi:hypothetical protein